MALSVISFEWSDFYLWVFLKSGNGVAARNSLFESFNN